MEVNRSMLVAGWSFTKICNLKCIHCYNASGRKERGELTLQEALRVADQLKEAGAVAVNFGGGECALRDDFIPLCEHLNDIGLKVSYTTNGTVLKRIEPYLHLFHDVGVSIDFADARRHDSFRGIPGSFDKAVETIRVLVKNEVENEVVTCITKLNCNPRELGRIYRLAKRLGVDTWRLNRFRANGRGFDNKEFLAIDKDDIKEAYGYLSRYLDDSVSVPDPLFRSAFGGRYFLEGDPSEI